jgi:hypothetical protein
MHTPAWIRGIKVGELGNVGKVVEKARGIYDSGGGLPESREA